MIDMVTVPERFEEVLKYVATRTAFVRQIFTTSKTNHIHVVAVSDDKKDLLYLLRMIQKKCGDSLTELHSHTVKEVIKDIYGGVNKYGQLSVSNSDGSDGAITECACEGETWEPTEIQDVPDEGDAGDSVGGT